MMCAPTSTIWRACSPASDTADPQRGKRRTRSRLKLALLTAKTLKLGLDTLGIERRRAYVTSNPAKAGVVQPAPPAGALLKVLCVDTPVDKGDRHRLTVGASRVAGSGDKSRV
ncbi:hypothetical protein MJ579_18655 [Klebsiella pneumoniae]|nr:hypothetical protein MJ579_18655 [Klebsiella pneumoniae]